MPDYDLGTARGRIELDASSLGRATAAFTGLGKAMIGTGALAVGAFAYAVKAAADFEKQMSAVGAVSNATAAEMSAMKDVALDLGARTLYGADQIGRAMEQLAKAGITVPDILNGATEATVNLAQAAGDELAGGVDQAAVVMANAMKTFGASADELDHFADVLVGAAVSSTLSVDDIATSMTYAGPAAANLGLSIDDLSTALAILGDRGIRGSTAGTSLRGVLLSLATQTPKAAGVMKDLGIITADGTNRFFDLNGALKPLPEVMQILGDATKNLSEQERIAAFNAIFQRRAMNAAMVLAEQGAAGFDKYAQAIARIDASDIAAKKLDNLSGDVTILRNAFEVLMIRVGMPFQEMLRGWVQSLTGFINKLNSVNPELLAQIALYAAVGGSALIAIGAFLMGIGVIVKLYRNFKILVEAIKLVAGAMKLLTISFLTNPLFLFIVALVAVAAALYLAYQRSEEFRARVDAALRALEPAFNAVKGFIENFVEQFGNLIEVLREGDDVAQGVAEVIDNMFGNTGNLIGPIRSIVMAIQQFDDVARAAFQYFADKILPTLWDFSIAVAQGIGTGISWLIDTGIPAVVEFANAVINQVGLAVDWFGRNVAPIFTETAGFIVAAIDRIVRVLKFFGPYFEQIWNVVVTALKAAWTIINTIVQNLLLVWGNFSDNIFRIITGAWERVKQTIESALRVIRGIIAMFTGILSGDWSKAWGGIQEIVSGVWALIGDIIQNAWFLIWNFLSAGIDALISIWETAWNTTSDMLGLVWNIMVSLVKGALDMMFGLINNGLSLVMSTFQNMWNAIYSWFAPKIQAFASIVGTVIDNIRNFFGGLWDKITGALGDLGSKAYNFFYTAWWKVRTAVVDVATELYRYVRQIPDNILSALGNLGRILYDAGKKIIGGLIDGIKNMIPSIGDVVGGIGGFIADHKGPEDYDKKLLIPQGGWIIGGLIKGIQKKLPDLAKLVSSVAPSISQEVRLAGASLIAPSSSSGDGNTSIAVTLEFPNVTSSEEAEAIKEAVNNDQVLSQLLQTLKAGRR